MRSCPAADRDARWLGEHAWVTIPPEVLLAMARTPGVVGATRRQLLAQPALVGGVALADVRQEIATARTLGCELIAWGDARYPASWAPQDGWPLAFWVLGSWPPELAAEEPRAAALVGPRRCSVSAGEFTFDLGRTLAASDAWVISGLAFGIDSAAHRGALAAHGRVSTVAVLAGGLSTVQPRANTALARAILDAGGCLMSSAIIDESPIPGYFPARNRLIAGLASVVAIIEASATSGALHTVAGALDHGRQVLTTPCRPWDTHALGSLQLLREGATPLMHPDDVLRWLPDQATEVAHARAPALEVAAARKPRTTMTVEEFANSAQISIPVAISMLERGVLEGNIVRTADGRYQNLRENADASSLDGVSRTR